MSLQKLESNYPEGHPGKCVHGIVDDGLDCIQCAQLRAAGHLDELQELVDYLQKEKDKPQAEMLVRDNIDDLEGLTTGLRTFLNKINPEIESWKNVVAQLTHEKGVIELRCDSYTEDLRQIILDNSTVHSPCDAKYIARCNPQEEQELGREQVLDEIRMLLEKYNGEK